LDGLHRQWGRTVAQIVSSNYVLAKDVLAKVIKNG